METVSDKFQLLSDHKPFSFVLKCILLYNVRSKLYSAKPWCNICFHPFAFIGAQLYILVENGGRSKKIDTFLQQKFMACRTKDLYIIRTIYL